MDNEKVGALVLGGDFQSLGIIRSLAENNIPVFLVENDLSISRFSRYVKRRDFNPHIFSDNVFVEYLIYLAKKENLKDWVIFPNNDEFLKMTSKNIDELSMYYRIPVPAWDIVQKFYYKESAYKIADELGIPIPKLYKFNNLEEAISSNLLFPLVIKPMFKITRKKAYRVNNEEEFKVEYNRITQVIGNENIIIQEFIEGGSENLYSYGTFFCGEYSVGLAIKRLRQHPVEFGTTTYAESVINPELEDMAIKLLKEIGYTGVAEVEFMKDPKDNKYKFIEINGRLFGFHTMLKGAGINLPLNLFRLATRQKIDFSKNSDKIKWIRSITDIPISLKMIISGKLKLQDYLNSLKGKKEFAVLDSNDPLPYLMEWILIPYLWYKRGF